MTTPRNNTVISSAAILAKPALASKQATKWFIAIILHSLLVYAPIDPDANNKHVKQILWFIYLHHGTNQLPKL